MIRKLIPIILGVIGLLIGAGAGYFLRPPPEAELHAAPIEIDPALLPEYVKLANQFIVPVLDHGKVISMVILSLSLEVKAGSTPEIYNMEPKLRDVFLQVMFDHANAGGFNGSYTDGSNLVLLRKALLEAAKTVMPETISDVLIIDIVRQDS